MPSGEQRKALERASAKDSGRSCLDGIPTAQPALALAQKVIARVTTAGLPSDLIPPEVTSVSVSVEGDAENDLRGAVLGFMDAVRSAEQALTTSRPDGGDRRVPRVALLLAVSQPPVIQAP